MFGCCGAPPPPPGFFGAVCRAMRGGWFSFLQKGTAGAPGRWQQWGSYHMLQEAFVPPGGTAETSGTWNPITGFQITSAQSETFAEGWANSLSWFPATDTLQEGDTLRIAERFGEGFGLVARRKEELAGDLRDARLDAMDAVNGAQVSQVNGRDAVVYIGGYDNFPATNPRVQPGDLLFGSGRAYMEILGGSVDFGLIEVRAAKMLVRGGQWKKLTRQHQIYGTGIDGLEQYSCTGRIGPNVDLVVLSEMLDARDQRTFGSVALFGTRAESACP